MKSHATAALCVLVVLSGCSVLSGGPPPSDQRALDARNRTAAAVEDVSTYRFSLDARIQASDGDERRTVDVTGSGAVDREARRMATNATADGETRSAYLDGRTAYRECPRPWGRWDEVDASESVEWLTLTPLGRQVELLERTEVYWEGTETVDGTETAVVRAHPSEETLTSLPDVGGSGTGDLSGANVDDATFRMWIDDGTSLPVRSVLRIEFSARGGSGDVEIATRFHGYGEPTEISIPEEARTEQWETGCPGE